MFDPTDYEAVCDLLHKYRGREKERIHFDILQLSDGSIERLVKLINMANTDYRDVIVAAEYAFKNGKYIKKSL